MRRAATSPRRRRGGAAGADADAVVVGSGPNGLAAAVVLVTAGLCVEVFEAAPTPGGGCRTEELTLPGYRHDVCATIPALATASPFFTSIGLESLGVTLRVPAAAFAHPLDGGRAAAVAGTVRETAATLGADGAAYDALVGPLVRDADAILAAVLAPPRSIPRRPVGPARFAALGLRSAAAIASRFSTDEARALTAGVAAHAALPLDAPLTGAFALVLTIVAHTGGWPVVEGGTARLVDALLDVLDSRGATVHTGHVVRDLAALPAARVTLLDTSPRGLLAVGGDRLGGLEARALRRFAYGPGVCKVDWALSGPVPWTAPACRAAATVHVGGTFEEVAAAEATVAAGAHPERPFCIVVQPCVADPTRAPAGHHTLWAYCHVPAFSSLDMTAAVESQIERFAPGFSDLVLARATSTALDVARANLNDVGGAIDGGAATLRQTVVRPTARWNPYRTSINGVYLCSASTPPGAGVHGMCGANAAATALRDLGVTPGP